MLYKDFIIYQHGTLEVENFVRKKIVTTLSECNIKNCPL